MLIHVIEVVPVEKSRVSEHGLDNTAGPKLARPKLAQSTLARITVLHKNSVRKFHAKAQVAKLYEVT